MFLCVNIFIQKMEILSINITYLTGLLWGIDVPKQVKLSKLQLAQNLSVVTSPVISSVILTWMRQVPQQNDISSHYKSGGGGNGVIYSIGI